MAIKQEAFKKKVVCSLLRKAFKKKVVNFSKIWAPSKSLAPVNFSQIPWDEVILALQPP